MQLISEPCVEISSHHKFIHELTICIVDSMHVSCAHDSGFNSQSRLRVLFVNGKPIKIVLVPLEFEYPNLLHQVTISATGIYGIHSLLYIFYSLPEVRFYQQKKNFSGQFSSSLD